MTFLRYFNILLIELFLIALPIGAQTVSPAETDSLTLVSDTLAADSISPNPEWYVAPEIPLFLRAPRRAAAAAASCTRVEAIQTFNIDSVLTEGTYYEYDAKGNVISTTVWTYNPDGTMTGKSKNEYAFDAAGTQTMTAVYIWDGAANDWKGTEKYEYVYKTFAGEKKMTSSTSSVWLNGAWVADQRFTYDYDASLREISYFEYRRNTSTNELQPVKGREQSWTDDLQTLEVLYTAYANGKWTAGTKKEWAFDGNGTQTMYATYTISNGAWVGSSKETWAYNTSSKLTLHEKYGWAGNDWSITLQEKTVYDASGNTTLIENYSWTNGVKTGTKKEEYSFDGGKPVLTMVYTWSNGAWIGSSKEVWNYNASSKLTLHEKYGWANNDWSLTLQEKTVYSGANITLIENYTWSNGVKTGTKKEEYTYSGSLKTSFVTYSWAGSDWVGESKEIWAYTSGKQTLHETYAWGATDWSITLQENTAYSGANITKIENYTWTNGTKTGTQKEEYAYTGSQKTQEIIYAWADTDWVESSKEIWGYTSGKQTLHEQYEWNGSWNIVAQENTTYTGANITKIENYQWINGVKTGTQKEEYTYTSGEKTMTVVYAWANNDWVYSTKNEAGYRDGNVEVSATNYAWNGNAWVGTGTRTQTTYDGTKIIEKLTKNWPSGATDWTNAAITTNTYNADGVNILTYNGTWNGSRWVMSSMTRTDIIIDDAGHQLLRASWKCSSDSVWKGVTKDTTFYSTTGKILYRASYTSWLNNQWVLSYIVESAYDDADRLILDQRYDWINGSLTGNYKYEYAFDAQGRQILSASYLGWSSAKNNWIGSSKNELEYDSNGCKIKEITYTWKSGNWVYNFAYTYQYDASGREIMQIVQRYSGDEWVYSNKYEKSYRGSTLVKDNVYRWRSNQWQLYTQNESYYDNQGKLRHVIEGSWNTRGVLQSYKDNHYFYDCDQYFYTVRFVNYDGQVLANMTAQEGETPVYSGSTPTKPADTENTYTFSGWNPDLAPVTSNVTYTATFTANKNTFTITWKNEDGSIIKQEKLEYGTTPAHADITKESTAEYTYTFAGWTPGIGIVTSDAEYTATFTQTKRSYVITFKNEDGSLINTAEVEYGTMPTIPTAPTKPADGANTYTFAGWDKEVVTVTEAATYTATYTATKKTYTITWKNEEGSVIESETLEYGATPAHANIYKENTAEWTYTFAGWSPEIVPVTGDAEYTATFTATKNKYAITFVDEDGTTLQTGEVEYGQNPEYTGQTPNKETTDKYTYEFTGWTPELGPVTRDSTYTATYTSTLRSYTITWLNWDNSQIDQTSVDYGTTPTHSDAVKQATDEYTYTFKGWEPSIVDVIGDATYTAQFDSVKNTYTITWLNEDNSLIDETTVEYGEMPTHADPTKEATAEFIYTFAGWTPEVVAVTGNATYTATFTEHNNQFTIIFLDEDGTTLQSSEVEYGETPVYEGETPAKEATAEWTYSFAGWDPAIVAVMGDATYTAKFDSTKNAYTITWRNWDDSLIDETSVDYGDTPTHDDAVKEATAEWTYTFSGWDPAVAAVTGEATYTAQFDSTKNAYTITWLNADGSEIGHETQEYGATPEHADIEKEATAEWTYSFTGWDPAVVAVIDDATYTATFDSTKNAYTITWLNADGSEIEHETLEYGATPEHADIEKEATAEWTYTFTGWDPAVVAVIDDATYTATFDSVKNSYTITWLNDDNSLIDQVDVEYGIVPSREDPTKENTAEYTYTFAGWDPEVVAVSENATYTATYDSVKNSYTITWLNADGSEIDHETLEYGVTPEHEDATKEATDEWTYTFAGWDPAVVIVNGDATYTAQFDSVKNSYTITWLNNDGSEIDQTTEEYGATPDHDDVVKEATAEWTYTFTGWAPAIVSVTGEATYTAQFDSVKNNYTITWLNDDNSLIDQVDVEYGIVPSREDPTKENTAEYTYTFAGWDPEVVAVSENATYTATYDSVKNSYTITWLNWDNSLIDETTVEYGVEPTLNDPTKDATDEYTYTFVGWNPAVVAVTGEATYTAQFDSIKNTYTITWLDDQGDEIDQTTEEYGATPDNEDAVKEATAEWTYTFTGWDPAITEVTGEATYTAQYDSTKNSYTITWLNNDGSEIDHETLEYGSTPAHADIDKEATAEWTYTFTGWDPEIVDVVGDATYTAQFDSVKNSYTITWLNWDNSQIDETIVEYGVEPTHDDPTKEATDEWTYTFAGWDPEITMVIEDATYTAQFDSVKNTYTITWLDDQGDEIDQTDVEYGVVPTHDDAIKEATAEWTYTFLGWTPEIVAVIGDATYTAQFDSTKNSYTITWLNADGTEIDHESLEYGSTPAHADIDKEATAEWTYTFAGWDPEIVDVVGDATYTAQFDSVKNTYTITWLNWDNSLIDETNVEYGVVPTHDDPTKEATDEWTYTFAGWDPEIIAVIGEATYTATFDSVKNTYTITWLNNDNSLIDQTDVEYGVVPTHDDAIKEATAEWTYTFTGWDPAIVSVTGEATYTAQFDSTKNSYTITWLNEDGTEIDHETLEYGSTPAHEDIDKENTAEWTYTFLGWEPEIVDVVGDATYTAQFDSVKNTYTITWLNWDNSLIDETTVEYGVMPTHDDPTKAETEMYSYTFAGWEPEVVAVTGNATYTATFDSIETTIYYHISITVDDATHGEAGFVYADSESSTLLTDNEVAEGTWIELQAKAADDWHFDHWSDGDTASVRQVEVTADMQFTAYFALNCGDYPTLPVVSLYDWLLMLDVRSIHAMGYTFSEGDVIWYRVNGAPDKESDGAKADDERVGTGYSFTLNESLVNSGDYYATVDVSSSPAGTLCSGMMRSQIVHFASTRAAMPPMLTPALVRPNEPQHILRLDPEFPTTVTIYDLSGHLLRTFSEEGVDRMELQAESVAGSYQVVVQNGDLRTVLRYIVVQ